MVGRHEPFDLVGGRVRETEDGSATVRTRPSVGCRGDVCPHLRVGDDTVEPVEPVTEPHGLGRLRHATREVDGPAVRRARRRERVGDRSDRLRVDPRDQPTAGVECGGDCVDTERLTVCTTTRVDPDEWEPPARHDRAVGVLRSTPSGCHTVSERWRCRPVTDHLGRRRRRHRDGATALGGPFDRVTDGDDVCGPDRGRPVVTNGPLATPDTFDRPGESCRPVREPTVRGVVGRRDGSVLAALSAELDRLDAVFAAATVAEVQRAVVAVEFERVELPAPVWGVQTRSEPDERAVRERQCRLDVAGGRRCRGVVVGPRRGGVGCPDAVDRPEPRRQQCQRVDTTVVQRPHIEERLRVVVPLCHPTDVGVGVRELYVAETTVCHQPASPALCGVSGCDRRTPQRPLSVAGEFDDRPRSVGVQRQRLLAEDVSVGSEGALDDGGVGSVARQHDHERRRIGREHPVEIRVGGRTERLGDSVGPLGVEITHPGDRQRGVVEAGGVRLRRRPRTDEQTVHTRRTTHADMKPGTSARPDAGVSSD